MRLSVAVPNLFVSVFLATLLASPPLAHAISLYTITDLGAGRTPTAISDFYFPKIAGDSGLWLGLGYSDARWSNTWAVTDINNRAEYVGRNYLQSGLTTTRLPFEPTAINNAGQVVGNRTATYPEGGTYSQPVIWDAQNGMRDLPEQGQAVDINDNGQVLYSDALLWSEKEGMVRLGSEHTYAVNDQGWAAGEMFGWPTRGGYGAVLYLPPGAQLPFSVPEESRMGNMISLYNPGEKALGGAGTGINNAGQVVGGTDLGAFTWFNGKFSFLDEIIGPATDWTLTTANDINEAGHIVGVGEFNGEQHGYFLDPVFDTVITQYGDFQLFSRLSDRFRFEYLLDSTAPIGSAVTYELLIHNPDGSWRLVGDGTTTYDGSDWHAAWIDTPVELIDGEYELIFRIGNYTAGSNPSLYLRNIVAAPVPEPATLLLLGSGLAGLAAWRRKRQ